AARTAEVHLTIGRRRTQHTVLHREWASGTLPLLPERTRMILGAEVAITILGLLFLIRGRSLGKNPVRHPHIRILGGFLLTLLPVVFGAAMIYGIVWMSSHPDVSLDEFTEKTRWPITGIEFGVVVLYAIIGTMWEKSIKNRVQRGG